MNQTNSILSFFFLLFLLLLGCEDSKQSSKDLITIDMDVTATYPKKELILQDFMDVEYVPLETKDEFLNQGFVRAFGKDLIIVTNLNKVRDGNIFLYDRTGKALRTINRRGQGAEEYSNIMEIILDEDNNELYVHNHYERKIQVYDLYGKFKRTLRYKDHTNGAFYTDMANFDKDNLICYAAYDKEKAFTILSKQDGSITKKIEIPIKETKMLWQISADGENYAFPDPHRTIIPRQGDMLLLEHSSDTVYSLLPDYSLHPFLVRTPSIHSMDPEVYLLIRFLSDRYYFFETIKNVYNFEINDGFPRTFMMYDTEKRSFFNYKVYNGDYSGKKEIYMNILRPGNQEIESWQCLDAAGLVESYEKGELKGKLKEIVATLNEESNPVIMMVKHKK